jgi:MoaA/NifB/PqqE/SkfB family radical SAM enzyme
MAVSDEKLSVRARLRYFLSTFYPQLLRSQSVVVHAFADGVCNSSCSWCITQYDLRERASVGKLPFDSFKKFLQLNAEYKFPLIPYGLGEPTIHKEFVPFCRHALDEGWTIAGIHSNFASPSLSDEVFDVITKFEYITINFGGGTRDTQKLNMKTDLDVTFANLKRLLDTKVANGSKLRIGAKMVLNKRNVTEVELLRQKIKQLSADINFGVYPLYFTVSDGSQDDRNNFFATNLATPEGGVDERVPCRDNVVLNAKGDVIATSNLKRCYGLNPTVNFNGDVTVCCRSRWYGGVVGNAFKTPMRDILKSKKYKAAEKRALKRKYVEYCKFCS